MWFLDRWLDFQIHTVPLGNHDDVIKWKHFPRCWPFVRGNHRGQRPVTRSFDVFFDLRLNKPLSNQLWCWWFETPSRSLWRHCNALIQSNLKEGCRVVNSEFLYLRVLQEITYWCNENDYLFKNIIVQYILALLYTGKQQQYDGFLKIMLTTRLP